MRRDQHEPDRYQNLADNAHSLGSRDRIKSSAHPAFDRVLNGHHGGIHVATAKTFERIRHAGGGNAFGTDRAGHGKQRGFGEGA